MHVIREYIVSSESVLFEGIITAMNGKRGEKKRFAQCQNHTSALDALVTEKANTCLSPIMC